MKRLSIACLFVCLMGLFSTACIPTIYAQSLPTTVTVLWDANAPSENVSSYDVKLDANPVIAVPATSAPSVVLTITTYGHHDLSIVAKSVTLACDVPTQCSTVSISSSAPTAAGFTVSPVASKPIISKITKP